MASEQQVLFKNLSDKLYEKRKIAAIEVERSVKDMWQNRDIAKIKQTIEYLSQEFAFSVFPNSRNGGLIGLAAVAIAMGEVIS
ncbi:Vacuole morphology and inheritance protein 14 domain-containing protein [Rozella allomycis CSF55]|uniref:Vacuole morphology and inheritance protein 14 domain-containing protein n=1 Tax=Rozella allomycis (strain CSF55) TaxID=988480 RepID=A0A075B0H6_ROZAC|nr:Vacuole morphology and inheritance protein 14 domain-containing protein [Rozella allomycis CSF55]|eukprot:EPZ34459.1 Vacuole morphology and inheritance protein 14 domain-containing protein [Rozella allomycis CSF55]